MTKIELLIKIADAGEPVTAADVKVTAARLRELEGEGLLSRPKGKGGVALTRNSGSRGRPAHLYKLTSKATKRVQRARKSETKAKTTKKAATVSADKTATATTA